MGKLELEYPQPQDRMQWLTAERNPKMAASAQAYVRGSTVRFYQWLEDSTRATLPEGPAVGICGDCHVGNLGPVANVQGALAIQVRDLDQTVVGNPVHDLIRLALSLAMAARGSDLAGVTTARIMERMIEGHEQAFGFDPDRAMPVQETPRIVRILFKEAAVRSWKHLADERIEGTEPTIPLGKRFWPLTVEERSAVADLFNQENICQLATSLRLRRDDAEVQLLDAAYWRKGCSSLGLLRVAVLLAVDSGKRERHCLIDVKEAVIAAAPRSSAASITVVIFGCETV